MNRARVQVTDEVIAYRQKGPLWRWLEKEKEGTTPTRRQLLMARFKISKASLNYWINGTMLPSAQKLITLCKLLNCSPAAYIQWYYSHPAEAQTCEDEPAQALS